MKRMTPPIQPVFFKSLLARLSGTLSSSGLWTLVLPSVHGVFPGCTHSHEYLPNVPRVGRCRYIPSCEFKWNGLRLIEGLIEHRIPQNPTVVHHPFPTRMAMKFLGWNPCGWCFSFHICQVKFPILDPMCPSKRTSNCSPKHWRISTRFYGPPAQGNAGSRETWSN